MREDARKHREELIEAASRAFARHGYDSSLQVVLDETYVTRGTLYRNFKDKDDLFVAVLEYEIEQIAEFVRLNAGQTGFFREYLRRQSSCASMHIPAFGKMPSNRLAQFIPSYKKKMDGIVSDVLEAARSAGDVRRDFSPKDLSLAVLMVAGPSIAGWKPSEKDIDQALRFLLDGLSGPNGGCDVDSSEKRL
jgi:AcrR family transcriptional regulator